MNLLISDRYVNVKTVMCLPAVHRFTSEGVNFLTLLSNTKYSFLSDGGKRNGRHEGGRDLLLIFV